jgi:hypothetical protein
VRTLHNRQNLRAILQEHNCDLISNYAPLSVQVNKLIILGLYSLAIIKTTSNQLIVCVE